MLPLAFNCAKGQATRLFPSSPCGEGSEAQTRVSFDSPIWHPRARQLSGGGVQGVDSPPPPILTGGMAGNDKGAGMTRCGIPTGYQAMVWPAARQQLHSLKARRDRRGNDRGGPRPDLSGQGRAWIAATAAQVPVENWPKLQNEAMKLLKIKDIVASWGVRLTIIYFAKAGKGDQD